MENATSRAAYEGPLSAPLSVHKIAHLILEDERDGYSRIDDCIEEEVEIPDDGITLEANDDIIEEIPLGFDEISELRRTILPPVQKSFTTRSIDKPTVILKPDQNSSRNFVHDNSENLCNNNGSLDYTVTLIPIDGSNEKTHLTIGSKGILKSNSVQQLMSVLPDSTPIYRNNPNNILNKPQKSIGIVEDYFDADNIIESLSRPELDLKESVWSKRLVFLMKRTKEANFTNLHDISMIEDLTEDIVDLIDENETKRDAIIGDSFNSSQWIHYMDTQIKSPSSGVHDTLTKIIDETIDLDVDTKTNVKNFKAEVYRTILNQCENLLDVSLIDMYFKKSGTIDYRLRHKSSFVSHDDFENAIYALSELDSVIAEYKNIPNLDLLRDHHSSLVKGLISSDDEFKNDFKQAIWNNYATIVNNAEKSVSIFRRLSTIKSKSKLFSNHAKNIIDNNLEGIALSLVSDILENNLQEEDRSEVIEYLINSEKESSRDIGYNLLLYENYLDEKDIKSAKNILSNNFRDKNCFGQAVKFLAQYESELIEQDIIDKANSNPKSFQGQEDYFLTLAESNNDKVRVVGETMENLRIAVSSGDWHDLNRAKESVERNLDVAQSWSMDLIYDRQLDVAKSMAKAHAKGRDFDIYSSTGAMARLYKDDTVLSQVYAISFAQDFEASAVNVCMDKLEACLIEEFNTSSADNNTKKMYMNSIRALCNTYVKDYEAVHKRIDNVARLCLDGCELFEGQSSGSDRETVKIKMPEHPYENCEIKSIAS